MTTGAKKRFVGSLIEAGEITRQVQLIADEVLGDQIITSFTDADTTPSVSVPNSIFKTANTAATTISDLDDGRSGQIITIIFGDANTTVDFTASGLIGNGGVDWTPALNDQMTCAFDGTDWYCSTTNGGGGASELSDLSDVNTSTPTDGNVLVADGTDFESRQLVTADISDLTADAAELNLLDLSGLTTGWALLADSATTASWQALPAGGGGVNSVTGGTNITATGTAADPILNLDAAITGTSVNGVTLTAAGAATNYLDETGNYSVANATHTGEVTGSTALTLNVTAITNRDDVVADSADDVAIHDDTDGTIKKVNLSSITDGGNF